MMKMAKETKQKQQLQGLETFFKLYNSNHGTVFYFFNQEQSKTVTVEFNLTLVNLTLQDAKPGASSFRSVLPPNSERYRILLPIERNIATSIKMGYSFSAEEVTV